jgi:hypothetical protein
MCGIAGFTLPFGLSAEECRARFGHRLRSMAASLKHRGPDAQTALLLDGMALGVIGYTPEQIRRVYDDIDQKRRATIYLHAPPLLLESVDELPTGPERSPSSTSPGRGARIG